MRIRARRAKDQQRVAVKVMLPRAAVDQTSVDKFLREIRSTTALRHPHILPVLKVGSSEGIFYLVMEYCAGGSPDYLMAAHGSRLSLELVGPIILQILEGLAFAHEQGIVHRDLKLPNILHDPPDPRQIRRLRLAHLASVNQERSRHAADSTRARAVGSILSYDPPFRRR